MSRDWEDTFRRWKEPSSDTEEQKCKNAEDMIRSAIMDDDVLSEHKIQVFAQGSYRNNTNVRHESDVDICIKLTDVFFTDFSMANGLTKERVGLSDSDYSYAQYKNEVESALINKFGVDSVKRGNKAFDVHANSYRVDADVVACFEHRRYLNEIINREYRYLSGTEFLTDNKLNIINWPQQNYDNGIIKNNITRHRYKYIVRCLKRLKNEMVDNGQAVATEIPSYLVECLVWNAPNNLFTSGNYTEDIINILDYTIISTEDENNCREWGEVNELKYLFRKSQAWTLWQTHNFLKASLSYIKSK